MRMFACYETCGWNEEGLFALFQCLISSSHIQGLVFNIGDDNPDDLRTVQWAVSAPSTLILSSDFILPIHFCKYKYIFYMVETNNRKTFQHCICGKTCLDLRHLDKCHRYRTTYYVPSRDAYMKLQKIFLWYLSSSVSDASEEIVYSLRIYGFFLDCSDSIFISENTVPVRCFVTKS
jgi:hypothetical protein